jgi:2-polyprenyl-3-methyl-5-hydroxy-6-metoxy-1,4-benzoquinol methylase
VHAIQKLYRALLPASVRRSETVARLKRRLLPHDWIYHDDYYATEVDGPAVRSAGRIAESILSDLQPSSVADVGCGTGALLAALRDRGCRVFGLEYSEAGLEYCRQRHLDVVKFDLEGSAVPELPMVDVAVSMEVAEHLPASVADRYVDLLTRLSSTVVFTAAPPGQGGHDHVNEQPASYWIARFAARGFAHQDQLTDRWRYQWQASGDVAGWYASNLMIFRRS